MEARRAGKRLFLCLRAGEKSAAGIFRRCEVQRDRAMIGDQAMGSGERGLVPNHYLRRMPVSKISRHSDPLARRKLARTGNGRRDDGLDIHMPARGRRVLALGDDSQRFLGHLSASSPIEPHRRIPLQTCVRMDSV
jgi:hypothetical protein